MDAHTRSDHLPQLPLTRRSVKQSWYHSSGTDTDRPSCSSTISIRGVTRTRLAVAVSAAAGEVIMPRLQQGSFVLLHEACDSPQLLGCKPEVVRHPRRQQPEFCRLVLTGDVYMCRFASIARKKEKSIRTASQNRRAHFDDCRSFGVLVPRTDGHSRWA